MKQPYLAAFEAARDKAFRLKAELEELRAQRPTPRILVIMADSAESLCALGLSDGQLTPCYDEEALAAIDAVWEVLSSKFDELDRVLEAIAELNRKFWMPR